jgi:hypothetical protein
MPAEKFNKGINRIVKQGKPQKGAADAAAKLIAKYGKAAVSSDCQSILMNCFNQLYDIFILNYLQERKYKDCLLE